MDVYHAEVREKVAPRLKHLPDVLQWLETNTAPLGPMSNGKAPKVRHLLHLQRWCCQLRFCELQMYGQALTGPDGLQAVENRAYAKE